MSNEIKGHRTYHLKARAESERQTRERIVQATMELHREIGPAKTTISEIARRANVTRLTVYNHFPDEGVLFGACQAHWMRLHPLPDFSVALNLADPVERVRGILHGLYGWYRETGQMAEHVQRDRHGLPALNALMERTADARFAELAASLSDGFRARRDRSTRLRTLIQLALDFWTWRRLTREGLDNRTSADLMTEAIAHVPLQPPAQLPADTRSRRQQQSRR